MQFEIYCEPRDLAQCIEDLTSNAPDVALLAGGTDLIPRLKDRSLKTKALINLMSVDELAGVDTDADGGLIIGAMTTLRSLLDWDALSGPLNGVRDAVGSVASVQVRNVATLGGNTCNASPAADTVPGLIAANTEVSIAGPSGARRMLLEDLFLGPGKTSLGQGEILVDFRIPPQLPRTGSSYKKHAVRGNSDVAMVGIGARISLDEDDKVADARVVMAAVAPTPIRSLRAERALVGRVVDEATIEEAAALASEDCSPITDVRATARYRTEMVRVFTKRAVREATERVSAPAEPIHRP